MSEKKTENEIDLISEKSVDDLKKMVALLYHNLEKVSRIIDNLDKEKRKEVYKSMPGVSGYFDGIYLIGEDGSKYEVPANYAAKSRIVYGDVLKMIEEDGKKLFKQIDKVPRKKLEGVLSKKEGKWYFLSDGGSYRISDVAAEFHNAELNDKAVAYVPENSNNATYAALDSLEKEKTAGEQVEKPKHRETVTIAPYKKEEIQKKVEKPSVQPNPLPIRGEKKLPLKKSQPPEKKKERKEAIKTEPETPKGQKEFIANILEEDDLR